ncbi:MAG: DUF4142 domain-containing protein [Bryobacteraceae bacterium]
MKRTLYLGLVSAGALLCTQLALAQNSGGGMPPGQNPSAPPAFPSPTSPTIPGQIPGMNGYPGPNTPASTGLKVDDKLFAKYAAVGAMVDLELSKLATEKASRDDVKEFAQKIVTDNAKANEQLKQVASKENIPIPDALGSKDQSRVTKLSKLSGDAFDKAYVKEQLKNQQAEVRDFSAEAQRGTIPNIKAFASNVLPTLQQHLELAKNLNKSEKSAAKQN